MIDIKMIDLSKFYSNDYIHGAPHIRRVYSHMLNIVDFMNIARRDYDDSEELDTTVLSLATIFHDIAREDELNNNGGPHNVVGAENARIIFEGMSEYFAITPEQIDRACTCIRWHRYSTREDCPMEQRSMELRILQDADRLDAIGYSGLTRVITYSCDSKMTLFDETKFPKAKYDGSSETMINHLIEKIIPIAYSGYVGSDGFNFIESSNIAKGAGKVLVDFVKGFIKENTITEAWDKYIPKSHNGNRGSGTVDISNL